MTLLFMVGLVAIGGYFLWRRGRGPDQPTVGEDIKSLFRFGKTESPHRETPAPRTPSVPRDGHSIEADPELTDSDRVEEIVELTELWNFSDENEKKKDSGL